MNDKIRSSVDNSTALKMIKLMEGVNDNVLSFKDEINGLKINIEKNNVILKQHHVRSTNLEKIVETVQKALTELTKKITSINTNVNRVDKDLEPIQEHVSKMEKYFTMFATVPLFFKFIFWLFVFVSSGYGCYNIVVKWLN